MKKIIILLLITFCTAATAQSQTIKFRLPEDANKEFIFSIPNGLKSDTIAKGQISMIGEGKIVLPEKYRDTPGLGGLTILDSNTKPIYIILEDHDFSFEKKDLETFIFQNSKENELFFNKRSEVLNPENENTYAQFIIKTNGTLAQIGKVLQNKRKVSLFEQTNTRLAALNTTDLDKLYYSQFWYFIIDGLLKMSSGEDIFANDMIHLLDKTKTDRVYTALVEDIITITNQFGMDSALDQIMQHVYDSKRIKYPQGNIFLAFEMLKVKKGSEAPIIIGLESKTNYKFTLLMFYESGCSSCQTQLEKLKENYPYFEKEDVRIVTIATDINKESYTGGSDFPWKDELCDFKGFNSQNVINYGVVATPTFYLINSNNKVMGRFSNVSETIKTIEQENNNN